MILVRPVSSWFACLHFYHLYIGNTTCVGNLVKRVIEMDPQLYVAAVSVGALAYVHRSNQ
jgi:hypothetical protein